MVFSLSKNITTYDKTVFNHTTITGKISSSVIPLNRSCEEMANSSNKLLVPGIEQYLDQVKYEIAQEFGVHLGSDTVSRANGSVGGEITKRLVKQAQAQMSGNNI